MGIWEIGKTALKIDGKWAGTWMPNQPKVEKRICENCAESFMARARDVRNGNGRFCSAHCRGKYARSKRAGARVIFGSVAPIVKQ